MVAIASEVDDVPQIRLVERCSSAYVVGFLISIRLASHSCHRGRESH